ncbi:energy-coupling factor ABC transporter permease [Algiphilus sp.]|uniref:energy-coupling factor ABC transporter permease n=1 Tax=Algiphilus sp. TaxID=1872431 RepID=UPI001CA6F99C|nr:energy-coupling factor ABC transporter permease [Algiphilus sp.]MBY8964506.1 energy-coupling factor ABC transporter permease [Algiphilus acroporae]MCI5062950.1 energy-coupling factor ABC transporter permease [Algiphilus sp.]MCI5105017.1 energy-coupling factor ABC transporter permease [Algiphilus sp.]MCR9090632.1 energy-coupling factor ABC transporter permease [Pseudomonadota bacterium]
MGMTENLLPAGLWYLTNALALVLLVFALRAAPWRRLVEDAALQHVLFGAAVALGFLWQMRAGIAPGLAIHILGITLLTLMMGWGLASLAGLMALAVTTLVGLEPWTSFGTNALICVLIPALVSHGVMLFERRLALRNFFGFIFISGFFGAGASVLAASLTISLLLWSGGVYAAHQLVHDYLRYLPLFVFPEAFLNGTMVAALTAFHPDRLLMLQQHRYHSR